MTPNMNKSFSDMNTGKRLIMSIISLMVVVAVISYSVYETTKATVTITVDGEETVVKTHANTVAELMMDHDFVVEDHDVIEPSLDTELTGNMVITWTPAKQVFVTNNGTEESVWTTATNVEELIDQLDITVAEHDKVSPSLTTDITNDMNITYESAFEITLDNGGEEQAVWTTSTTVADFLDQEEISLGELDRVEPTEDEQVTSDLEKVSVVRVEKVTDIVEEATDYATVTRKDDSLESGNEQVVQSGEEGQVKKHFEVVLENGEEVSRELVKTETVKESTDRIVAVGTRPSAASVSRSSSPSSSSSGANGQTLTVTATAYTANCSGCSGITATGVNLNQNRNQKVIAVDPNVIPLGTRVHVEGYGEAVAADTGGAIKGNKIDVHVPTKTDARNWGRKQVTVTILD
ncbi:G5 and 3D domain-containing protein [Desertibacillus haloalkaliphilus]|uniref:G5 and 3D domain-containing protein n=1 Tax=Desertibacillus haloalkaliphilus TaxID=1328930 RepID=UPI001C25B22D|nr:G5 and 3D domain-containing protein [Desertibacillus haloalkaliphilus]MBU8908417.1 DUF348 domain-containing protein [Desertibacillus haloalkaliphilus]